MIFRDMGLNSGVLKESMVFKNATYRHKILNFDLTIENDGDFGSIVESKWINKASGWKYEVYCQDLPD